MDPAWIEVTIEKLQRAEGGAVVTRTNISARKHAEHEARVQQQQLTHLGRAAVLGQLSGSFAHELNQPLTSILGNAEAALRMIAAGNVESRRNLGDTLRHRARRPACIPGDRSPAEPAGAGRPRAPPGGSQCHGLRGARPREERIDHAECPCRHGSRQPRAGRHRRQGADAAGRAESPDECLRCHDRPAGRGSKSAGRYAIPARGIVGRGHGQRTAVAALPQARPTGSSSHS